MDKKEFLEILKQSLAGEVSRDVIEMNIRFYDQYISSQADEEEITVMKIGDPRLIAKTIIEKEKAANKSHNTDNSKYTSNYEKEDDQRERNSNRNIFITGFTWYHKLITILIIIAIIIVIAFLARILFGLLFAFGVPILLLLLLVSLFKKK